MRQNSAIVLVVFAAVVLSIAGCQSKPTPHTNASCNLTEAQVTDFTARGLVGDGDAAWRLCEYYEFIKFDQAAALKWMEIAAKDGNLSGQYNLAHEYEGAFDARKRDLDKARYWYQRAADQGDADAKSKLAELNGK